MRFLVFLAFLGLTFLAKTSVARADEVAASGAPPPVEIVDVSNLQPREMRKPAQAEAAPSAEPEALQAVPAPDVLNGLRVERHIEWMSVASAQEKGAGKSGKISLKISWAGPVPVWSESELQTLREALAVILAIKPGQVPPLRRMAANETYETSFILKSGLIRKVKRNGKAEEELILPHPVLVQFNKIRPQQDSPLGPAGEFRVTTTVADFRGEEAETGDCLASSPWLTAERLNYKVNGTLVVEDRVVTKKTAVSAGEFSEPVRYQAQIGALDSCLRKNSVSWMPPVGTPGPAAAEMTPADEVKLRVPAQTDEGAAFKRLKYLRLRARQNPADPEPLARQAESFMQLRTAGGTYRVGYLEDALAVLAEAESRNEGKFHPVIYSNRILAKMHLGHRDDALADLKALRREAPNSYESRRLSAELSLLEGKLAFAREWIARAGTVAAADPEKLQLHDLTARLDAAEKGSVTAAVDELQRFESELTAQANARQRAEEEARVLRQAELVAQEAEVQALMQAGNYDGAVETARRALAAAGPEDTRALRELAGAAVGKKAEAVNENIIKIYDSTSARTPASVTDPAQKAELARLVAQYEAVLMDGLQLCSDCEPILRKLMFLHNEKADQDPREVAITTDYAERILKQFPGHVPANRIKERMRQLAR